MQIPIIGVSQNIRKIRELIDLTAETGLNIVITGESGVGKEVVAQALYQRSPRADKPFIKINCAALPEGLLESELFGHEQGAFTGAERKKRGKFELAHGGVLLLDEIGDMSISLQSKLLHVLQSGEFAPLGSEKEFTSDAWIIAATNHSLEDDVKAKKFREDLYYRLNIIKIHISPLRERMEDIPHLIDFYLKKYSTQFENVHSLLKNDDLIKKLTRYHWPGNVRELQNILRRMLVTGNWEETIDELLNASITTADSKIIPASGPGSIITDLPDIQGHNVFKEESFSLKEVTRQTIDKVEKEVISYVLEKTGWNRSKASKILKISYKTLLHKITLLDIVPPS